MPLIGARVHGNAIGAEPLHVNRGFHHIGVMPAATVSEGGNLIDVDG
jgi:hypothetical protein